MEKKETKTMIDVQKPGIAWGHIELSGGKNKWENSNGKLMQRRN